MNGQIFKQGANNADFHVLRDLTREQANTAFIRLSDAIARDIELNIQGSEEASVAAEDAYHTNILITLCLIELALLCGFTIALMITRSIVAPIKDAARVAKTVADGFP